jgi:hypothetical protein
MPVRSGKYAIPDDVTEAGGGVWRTRSASWVFDAAASTVTRRFFDWYEDPDHPGGNDRRSEVIMSEGTFAVDGDSVVVTFVDDGSTVKLKLQEDGRIADFAAAEFTPA